MNTDLQKTLFWIGHASFYIKTGSGTIFIDPFNIGDSIMDRADLILITHAHYDHCNKADIKKVMKPDAEIYAPSGCLEGDFKNKTVTAPGFSTDWKGIKIGCIPAYNNKPDRINFHPRANNWVGYIIDIGGFNIYHAGDTDFIDEMKQLKNIGAGLLPMGGKYVMDVDEMITAARTINPVYVVPMHYKRLLEDNGVAAETKLKKELKNALVMREVQ